MLKHFLSADVLYGHSVSNPIDAPSFGPDYENSLAPEVLDTFLKNHGHGVRLTFDDGYLDNLTTALPILERYQVSAIIFITTGFVQRSHSPTERIIAHATARGGPPEYFLHKLGMNNSKNLNPEQLYKLIKRALRQINVSTRMYLQAQLMETYELTAEELNADILSREQIRILDSNPLITIGAHSVSHPNLRYTTDKELDSELRDSRSTLERWLGHPVTEMAYPYGGNDKRVRRAVSRAGYKKAFTTQPRGRQKVVSFCSKFALRRRDLNKVATG